MITDARQTDLFDEARDLMRERGQNYGNRIQESGDQLGLLWTAMFQRMGGDDLSLNATKTYLLLAAMKLARAASNTGHKDSYVDALNYINMAWESRECK